MVPLGVLKLIKFKVLHYLCSLTVKQKAELNPKLDIKNYDFDSHYPGLNLLRCRILILVQCLPKGIGSAF